MKTESSRGFTLVELMATVAIVGVLAAIAVPNYMKYQRKARQTEAKTVLASLFTLEAAAGQSQETGNSFHGCLSTLGTNLAGLSYYSVGFTPGTVSASSCGPTANGSCLAYSWSGTVPSASCLEGAGTTYFLAQLYSDPATGPVTAAEIAATGGNATSVARGSFMIGATGAIGGGTSGAPTLDTWLINEQKSIFQTVDGVN